MYGTTLLTRACGRATMTTMDESRSRCALDVHADEHAGAMTMCMTSDGAFLRREGPESEPATAYPTPKVLRRPCVGTVRARRE